MVSYIAEDKGPDSDKHRIMLKSQNNVTVIPGRKNRIIKIEYNKAVYNLRKK